MGGDCLRTLERRIYDGRSSGTNPLKTSFDIRIKHSSHIEPSTSQSLKSFSTVQAVDTSTSISPCAAKTNRPNPHTGRLDAPKSTRTKKLDAPHATTHPHSQSSSMSEDQVSSE